MFLTLQNKFDDREIHFYINNTYTKLKLLVENFILYVCRIMNAGVTSS